MAPNGPAALSGDIQLGDELIAVDGEEIGNENSAVHSCLKLQHSTRQFFNLIAKKNPHMPIAGGEARMGGRTERRLSGIDATRASTRSAPAIRPLRQATT